MFSLAAQAVEPDEVLADPALEARAREISQDLRCVVCKSQSIDDSDAPLAKDLRLLVRERLVAGDSDREVVDYVVARYGDYVLLKPRFGGETLALWLAPLVIAAFGLVAAGGYLRNREKAVSTATPLTKEEAEKLRRMTDSE